MVVPAVVFPEEPCQLMVQPPAWLPMSSALDPATYTFWFGLRGRTAPSFFSRTCDLAAASRATARWAAEPTSSRWVVSAYGFSKRPRRNFWVRMRATASSIRAWLIRPAATSSLSVLVKSWYAFGTMIMSSPALTDVRTSLA